MPLGGTNVIHFIGVTRDGRSASRRADAVRRQPAGWRAAMSSLPKSAPRSGIIPARCCAASRSAQEPTALYRDLHAVADAAFDAVAAVLKDGAMPREVIEAAGVIERAGFTIIDDLLHGYGGGYLPPILGSQSRPSAHVPDEPFRAGMIVVIQPNVVTPRRQGRRADRRDGARSPKPASSRSTPCRAASRGCERPSLANSDCGR